MAIRRKKSKTKGIRYSVRMHVGGGKYEVIGTWPSKAVAREEEAKWIASRQERERGSKQTGAEWAGTYLADYAERVKSSTLHHAEAGIKCWLRTFGSRTLVSIDNTEAEGWARENKWAVPPVVTMLNHAVRREVLPRNQFSGLTKKGPGRKHNAPLSVADVEKLAAVAKSEHGEGLAAFIRFTAYSGMRVGEVFALKWEDIDFKASRIFIRRRLYRGSLDLPKSNKARKIVLLPEAMDALLGLDRSTDWIFQGKRGGQMSQSGLTYYWQKIESGFGRAVQPHELRHFCGHHLYVTMGLPDRVVAEQLCHNDGGEQVRKLYGHGDVGALDLIEREYRERSNVVPFRRAAGSE